MSEYALEFKNVSYQIANREILKNIDFKVKKGSIHGFLGPNGAGKSTSMRLMTGVLPTTSGEIFINNQKMEVDQYQLKNQIGYLPENPPLYEDMSVLEYLKFMAGLREIPKAERKESIERVLESLKISDVMSRLIGNLSRGYKQRVGLAQSLLHKPSLLVLDEPTLGLDPYSIADIRELILGLASECTIILSSHQLHEIEKLCDEMTFIHEGHILETGAIDQFKKNLDLKTQKIQVKVLSEDLRVVLKLKELNYIHFVHSTVGRGDGLNTLEIEIDNNKQAQIQLTSDLVRYGLSPIEILPLNNLEHYFLDKVRK